MSGLVLIATQGAQIPTLFKRGKISNAQGMVSCLVVAECSVLQLVVGDTKRGWGKHLSKPLVLIEGREKIISLALVIFQGTW